MRPLSDLINPSPYYGQTYPYGFLLFTKIAVNVFGNNEYAFRLFPLLCGISSLFLFYKVAIKYIRPEAVPIALGLFAILDPLVQYSSELKPYMVDVTTAIVIYLVILNVDSKKLTTFNIGFYALFGASVLWFSHPSLFVLVGIGLTLTVSCFIRKEWAVLRKMLCIFSIWSLSFIILYLIYTKKLMANLSLLTNNDLFWIKGKAFMPLIPKSFSDIQWFLDLPTRIFNFPVGLSLTGLATFTFIAGCISSYDKKKEKLFFLIFPSLVALIASGFKKYAFVSVPIFFIVPSIILLIAEGTDYIRLKTRNGSSAVSIVLTGLLFIYPLSWASYHAIKPDSREEIKPVLRYIKNHWQQGDMVYVYYMSIRAFDYYSKYHTGEFHFDENEYTIGRAQRDWYATYRRQDFKGFWNPSKPFSQPIASVLSEYTEDLDRLKGHRRVWFLFSSTVTRGGIFEENFFLYHLDAIGKHLDSYGNAGNAAVYLYDLKQTSQQ